MTVPETGPCELLVKIIASGICGSDVMEWYRIGKAPLVLGHEIAGEIAVVGGALEGYRVGDRVVVSHHVPCNTCKYCLAGHHTACHTLHITNFDPGGFAEYVRVPAINVNRGVFFLPEEVSFEEGTFVEPLGCVVRAQRLAGVRPGSSVLVVGSGISGLLHIKLAAALGAGRIVATDVSQYRLDAAARFGATAVINAAEDVTARIRGVNDGHLADFVIVCTAAATAIDQALRSVDPGGTIVLFAATEPEVEVAVPMGALWRDQVTIMTSYAAAPADLDEALGLIRAGRVRVDDMITHRLSLAETGEGFRIVADAADSIKVIVQPQR